MAPAYNPVDWYWIVATNPTQVYSSSRGTYVPTNDAIYQSWKALGNISSNMDSESHLGDVLVNAGILINSSVLVIQQVISQYLLQQARKPFLDLNLQSEGGTAVVSAANVGNFIATAVNNYRSLRAQINAATTAAQVQAINLNSGWPANP